MGTCFALKHQRHCRKIFYPSLINLEILGERWLQQEIKEAHDNKEAYNTWPIWDHKNHAVRADLIKQHFQQIQGRDIAPSAYLMREHTQPPAATGPSDDHAESFNDQMIKQYPIIKPTELLTNTPILDMEPPLKYYTCKEAEDNAQCFQELKCFVQGTEAEVYIDNFNVHSEFQASWRKLYNIFLGTGTKDTLATQLERDIQTLWYSGLRRGFTFNTYVECHKQAYQFMLAQAKKTDYTASDPSTCIWHFLNGITDPALAQAKFSLKANSKQYSGNFDATVEYLMNQVLHQQVNKPLCIASVGSDTASCHKTCNNRGQDLKMLLIEYLPKDWVQLSSAQKSSIC